MFGRNKKEQPLPALTDANQSTIPADLKALFAKAAYGEECRTLAFVAQDALDEDRHEYRVAKATTPQLDQWIIQTATQTNEAETRGQSTKFTATQHGVVSFFEAIEILSNYEQGQTQLGMVADIPGKEELGTQHFEALALQEGIIFDTSGIPHPPKDGHIVTDGDFSPEMIAHAKQFQNMPKLRREWQAHALNAMTAKIHDGISLNELLKAKVAPLYLNDLATNFGKMLKAINGVRKISDVSQIDGLFGNSGYCHHRQIESALGFPEDSLQEYRDHDGELSRETLLEVVDCAPIFVETCQESLDAASLPKQQKEILNNAIAMTVLLFEIVAAKAKIKITPTSVTAIDEWKKDIRSTARRVKAKAEALNLSDTEIEKLKLSLLSGEEVKIPGALHSIHDQLVEMAKLAETDCERLENRAFQSDTSPTP